MELPHLGKHCEEKHCNQLDFLPFSCKHCGKNFCKDHWQIKDHDCIVKPESLDARAVECPACGAVLNANGSDPNVVVDRHIKAGCNNSGELALKKARSNICSVANCKRKELTPILCKRCLKNFCLRHRLDVDHDCTALQSERKGRHATSTSALAAIRRSKAQLAPGAEDADLQRAIEASLQDSKAVSGGTAVCALS